jgi:hypothetical protein
LNENIDIQYLFDHWESYIYNRKLSIIVALGDGTVAYVIPKVFMLPEGTFFMHVLYLSPLPGNPDDDRVYVDKIYEGE